MYIVKFVIMLSEYTTKTESETLAEAPAEAKTDGAKMFEQLKWTALEVAARKAATTGNRTDLHKYLIMRRNFL